MNVNAQKLYGITADQLNQIIDIACEIDGNACAGKGRMAAQALHALASEVAGTDELAFYPNHEILDALENGMCQSFAQAFETGDWFSAYTRLSAQSCVLLDASEYGTALYELGRDYSTAATIAMAHAIELIPPTIPDFLRKQPAQEAA